MCSVSLWCAPAGAPPTDVWFDATVQVSDGALEVHDCNGAALPLPFSQVSQFRKEGVGEARAAPPPRPRHARAA
eukprot:gene9646-biopygen5168